MGSRTWTLASITAGRPLGTPPEWAVLERRLFAALDAAAQPLLEKYVRPDGSILWPTRDDFQSTDGLDDAYESFHNWPLYYLLGGSSDFLGYSHREFEAITAQFTRYGSGHGYPMVVKEYQPAYDWFHQGEGNYLFYMLSMADPGNPLTVERAQRFAGFYLGEDPEAPNYDAEHKIIRCAHNGSRGPAYWQFTPDGIWTQWGYGLPFYDVPGCRTVDDLRDPAVMRRIGRASQERRGRGDTSMNLAATTLATNAYLLTGDGKYRRWVEEYTGAWMERAAENGGILPDNVGLSGIVGEHTGGKWWGGNYGWTWPHGWYSFGQGVLAAAENAHVMTRDARYLDFPRGQMDALAERGIVNGGTLYVPFKYGDPGLVNYVPWPRLGALCNPDGTVYERDGWHEYIAMQPFFPAHVWNASMESADLERMLRFRDHGAREWETIHTTYEKDQGGNDEGWVAYLQGEYPGYPEAILEHNLQQVSARLDAMDHDTEPPEKYSDAYLQFRNPITCEGLVQLTLGGPLPVYNGGLLLTRVRYYDWVAQRPGLPEDVAALVSEVTAERTRLTLVNLGHAETREVIVQAGSLRQHRFGAAWVPGTQDRIAIDGAHVRVVLPPLSQITLELETQCFVSDPSYGMV